MFVWDATGMYTCQAGTYRLKPLVSQMMDSVTPSGATWCECTYLDGILGLRQPDLHTLHILCSCVAGLCSRTAGLKPGVILSFLLQGLPGLLQAATQLRDLPALPVQLSLHIMAPKVIRQCSACKHVVMCAASMTASMSTAARLELRLCSSQLPRTAWQGLTWMCSQMSANPVG